MTADAMRENCKDGHDFHRITGKCNRCNVHASDTRKPEPERKVEPKAKASVVIKTTGPLALAIVEVAAEVNARNESLEGELSDADTARRLLAYAIREHRAGRGPWPKTPTR